MEENEQDLLQRQTSNLPGFLSNIFQGNQQNIKIDKLDKKLTAQEYFHKHTNVNYYLNGSVRSIKENRRIQTFNATLSLCENYPLFLHEQILPIVDLMALNNSHFKKLKEFITLQLPSGFPIKIGNYLNFFSKLNYLRVLRIKIKIFFLNKKRLFLL